MKVKIILISILFLIAIAIWTWPESQVKVIFCDVGQGDGTIVIQGNFQMLIDVGPENNKMVDCLSRHIPFWDKAIEAVIVSHADSDHVGGLNQVKKYYNVQNIYTGNLAKNDVVKYKEIVFEVLSPAENWGNDNDNSVVGELAYRNNKILFLGDVTSNVEQKLVWRGVLRQGSGTLILKISHHGSAEATSEELLQLLKPSEAVISVGKKNKFGHPTKLILDRLEKYKVKIRRTDIEGDILYIW